MGTTNCNGGIKMAGRFGMVLLLVGFFLEIQTNIMDGVYEDEYAGFAICLGFILYVFYGTNNDN